MVFPCGNRDERSCEYYVDTNVDWHALRGDGKREAREDTVQWECRAGGGKHAARPETPTYQLKPASECVTLTVHPRGCALHMIRELIGDLQCFCHREQVGAAGGWDCIVWQHFDGRDQVWQGGLGDRLSGQGGERLSSLRA
jgi:hypothetical protein